MPSNPELLADERMRRYRYEPASRTTARSKAWQPFHGSSATGRGAPANLAWASPGPAGASRRMNQGQRGARRAWRYNHVEDGPGELTATAVDALTSAPGQGASGITAAGRTDHSFGASGEKERRWAPFFR